ncbi:hypothetical protein EB74_30050 [Mycobacterium sp. SWH-M5]|uniref:ESX secretion-associated protein EspG n=1 Tax=Mycolicibacterium goodii TaxID=134601 RepID=UPI000939D2E4|nr:ESX secretion-associated protein EspG [Mycolicibacterium goodii]MBU8817536.1 ESX secretion-associated protein EspG [Mycolicibacterium goodii]OKH69409.1 hypothetical protein EB74_30050 [Mycobacterium sp. SWH-M5]
MAVATTELTFTVSALLAFQRLASITTLPAHLRIRPQLLKVSDTELDITDAERETLESAELLTEAGLDPDALVMLRALSSPDTEINLTLGARERLETYVVLARRHHLLVAATRCGDDVTIDAYTHVTEAQIVTMITETIRHYVFGAQGDDAVRPTIERVMFPLSAVYDTLCSEQPQEWKSALEAIGVPRSVAGVLHRSETELVARAEVAAYLNHEGGRSQPDTIARLTTMGDGQEAIITSFSSDNNARRWLTVEPYDAARLERVILGAIRSVPDSAWFTHSRTD